MKKNITLFWQKIALVMFGIILAFFFLEAALRTAGFILTYRQEHRNILRLQEKGVYRIMCIGESTTQGEYPPFLEEILNKAGISIKFSVIDAGVAGADTSRIAARLEESIKKYHPHMVIAMIGINDGARHIPPGFNSSSRFSMNSLKTCKFARILSLRILNKIEKLRAAGSGPAAVQPPLPPVKSASPKNPEVMPTALGKPGTGTKKNPGVSYYLNLGKTFLASGQTDLAAQAFEKAMKLNPYETEIYFWTSYSKRRGGRDWVQDVPLHRKLIMAGRLNGAVPPIDLLSLAHLMSSRNKHHKYLEEFCKNLLGTNPNDAEAHLALGYLFLKQGRHDVAEGHLKSAIRLNPEQYYAYDYMAVLYHDTGKLALSEYHLRKARELRFEDYLDLTVNNYKKIKEILDAHNVQLVAVQYPLRRVETLRTIFSDADDVIFVDNESVFQSALKTAPYRELFRDMFAGDFGHCTPKGNKLLGENIAKVILKEVFHEAQPLSK